MSHAKCLVIDSDPAVARALKAGLEGWSVIAVASVAQALPEAGPCAVALLSVSDADAAAADIAALRNAAPTLKVIALALPADWPRTGAVLQRGAFDYLEKPLDPVDVGRALARARAAAPGARPVWELVGISEPVHRLYGLVKRVAPTDSTILILGDSGTGKELIARAVHANSRRAGKAYVTVNCGAFTPTLLESELFGHVRGAFTGADRNKQGLVEAAHGGTFFLDEIGEMQLDLQVKLLRLIEELEFIPVGANKPTQADVRFVCATNRNLAAEVRAGRFREDLYYRLNVIPLDLPPLRERSADALALAGFFIARYGTPMQSTIKGLDPAAAALFQSYPWPGNVRELENSIQRALALADPGRVLLSPEDFEERLRREAVTPAAPADLLTLPSDGCDLEQRLETIEVHFFRQALAAGDTAAAAARLGLTAKKFKLRCGQLGISP